MHVPDESLDEYRYWRDIYRQLDSLGNEVSGRGEHGLANACWRLAGMFKARAGDLRVGGRDG